MLILKFAFAVALQAQSKDVQIDFPVEKFQLENGLTVLLAPDSRVPLISFQTWYRVGSRDEQPGVTGAAHMLEHMMFKGAKKYSGKEFWRILQANGITTNAFTSQDYTGFYLNLPSSKLELVMDMELDRMRFLKLDPADLKSELQVVGEERRLRTDNNPISLLYESLMSKLFQKHPYHWPIIGWMPEIQAYTVEKLRPFYDRFYVPNNAVLVLSGQFESRSVKRLIQQKYGVLKANPLGPRVYPQESDALVKVNEMLLKDVQNETFLMLMRGTSATSPDAPALDVAAGVLSMGSSSRLYKTLVYKEKLASFVTAYSQALADPGVFVLGVGLKPNVSFKRSFDIVNKELESLRQQLISEAELKKVKNQMMTQAVEELRTFEGRARALAQYEIVHGDYTRLFRELDDLQKVTREDVRRVSQKYLRSEGVAFGRIFPSKASVAKTQE